ncbi:MAG: hypothetical protein IPH16_16155 [Haliscomenobacter sp.]|nr:hypothetical protein [Haliscomenobacter sp.]MBK7477750.1 hypothetical protein [Haliscomenobacter sp.]
MKAIVNRLSYDTETATKVATDYYWDGHNWDRNGRNVTLYRTPNGRFFLHRETRWQGERDMIEPISQEGAKNFYEELPEKKLTWSEAFGEDPQDA